MFEVIFYYNGHRLTNYRDFTKEEKRNNYHIVDRKLSRDVIIPYLQGDGNEQFYKKLKKQTGNITDILRDIDSNKYFCPGQYHIWHYLTEN